MTSDAAESIEITVGETSDMEVQVYARYRSPTTDALEDRVPIVLRGTLRGPYCEHARTLPAEFVFRSVEKASPPTAEAVVTDPCMWTPELPHMYQADVEALCGGAIVAEYHGMIGLKSTTPRRTIE